MIHDLGDILLGLINNGQNYIDVSAGVVQVETMQKMNGQNSLIKRKFPIYCPVKENCDDRKIKPLIPDKNLKSLLYMEANNPVSLLNVRSKYYNYRAIITLVCWLNPKKLGKDTCSISSIVSTDLTKILNIPRFNNGYYNKIKITTLRINPKDPRIFSKYEYTDKFYNLLEYPYDYFSMDVSIDFSMHENCIEILIPDTPIEC